MFAIVWVLVLGRFDPKFVKWGAFQINCFIIGAVTASVLLAYILSFWPVVCIGAVEKPLQIVVIGFVGCIAAYWYLYSGAASHFVIKYLGIHDWWGDIIGIVIATVAAFIVAGIILRLAMKLIKRRTEQNTAADGGG